jgi:hypothetical protein
MPGLDTIFWLAAGILTVSGVVRYVVYPMWREVKDALGWWRKFQRDWDGEPEEPGRTRVPGVMERLNGIDGQLHRNGGESLKDKVCDTHELALGLSSRVGEIEVRQIQIAERLESIESRN